MAQQLGWREAVIEVLRKRGEAMTRTDIANQIAEQKIRTQLGATPDHTVAATISNSLKDEGPNSPFLRVQRGLYSLREFTNAPAALPSPEEEPQEAGLINAFGMFWSRSRVDWAASRILGQGESATKQVDFYNQRGVYLLYDGRAVVYVGRATDGTLGDRLKKHTEDRLAGRWDRFSWFGVYPVSDDGKLNFNYAPRSDQNLIVETMEALLIEGLEPPQNRRRGDGGYEAMEFNQVEDPDLLKKQKLRIVEEMKNKI